MPARSRLPDSTRATLNPALASTYAAIPPPGPLPTTQTSKTCFTICSHRDYVSLLLRFLAGEVDLCWPNTRPPAQITAARNASRTCTKSHGPTPVTPILPEYYCQKCD